MPKILRRRKETAIRTQRSRGKSKTAAVGWSRAAARLLDRSWEEGEPGADGLSWRGTVR